MRLPRWKREQKDRKRTKIFSLVRIILGLGVLGLIILGSFLFIFFTKSSKLTNDGRITIVLATSPTSVVTLDPKNKQMAVIIIPDNTYIEVTHGFGMYPLGSVWALGKEEKIGGELLSSTLEEFLGVSIDGWMGEINNKWQMPDSQESILQLKKDLTSWNIILKPQELLGFPKNTDTNLSFMDLVKIWFESKSIKDGDIKIMALSGPYVTTDLMLADGSKVMTSSPEILDKFNGDLFKDPIFTDNSYTFEVLNGTDQEGLGSRVARLITNSGGRVISINNSQEKPKRCLISGTNEILESPITIKLKNIYNCETKPSNGQNMKADLQITLGNDYWQRLFKK